MQSDWYSKTNPKTISNNWRNECQRRACVYRIKCTFQLANSTKIIILLVLFKNRAKVILVNAIQIILEDIISEQTLNWLV